MEPSLAELMDLAGAEARRVHSIIAPVHLFIATCRLEPSAAVRAIALLGADIVSLRRRARALVRDAAKGDDDNNNNNNNRDEKEEKEEKEEGAPKPKAELGADATRVIDGARSLASAVGRDVTVLDVLVTALLLPDAIMKAVLEEVAIVPSGLAAMLLAKTPSVQASPSPSPAAPANKIEDEKANPKPDVPLAILPRVEAPASPASPAAHRPRRAPPPKLTGALAKFGKDLSALAHAGKLEPIVGRKTELKQIVHVLLRKSKNNAVLVGDAGVGKTAIVEALAQLCMREGAPEEIANLHIVELLMTALLAGAKYHGDLEERLQQVITQAEADPNLVLFIDELHLVVGAGAKKGAMDVANILKPPLARGGMRVLGATTPAEFRNSIEEDAALERRFQPVRVDEPTPAEAREILATIAKSLTSHHGLVFEEEAIDAAIELSVRYLPDRRLPDKARDLLDQAAAAKRLATFSFDAPKPTGAAANIVREDIAKVIAQWTGVPLERLTSDRRAQLASLEEKMRVRVIGQDAAVADVADVVRMGLSGLQKANRPRGVMLLVGPTGVGKTEIAKSLAEILFGDEKALLRFDMAEYVDKHTVQRLIGSPPGYIGHDEGGQLTNAIRRAPYAVVLFDEVEKAHRDVSDIYLSIFDDGRLTDTHGRLCDFSNAFILMTSNALGSVTPQKEQLGFRPDPIQNIPDAEDPRRRPRVARSQDELRAQLVSSQVFRPELVGRIGRVIELLPLGREELRGILRKTIRAIASRAEHEGVHLRVTPEAEEALLLRAGVPGLGARVIEQLVDEHITRPLAKAMVDGSVSRGTDAEIVCAEERIALHVVRHA